MFLIFATTVVPLAAATAAGACVHVCSAHSTYVQTYSSSAECTGVPHVWQALPRLEEIQSPEHARAQTKRQNSSKVREVLTSRLLRTGLSNRQGLVSWASLLLHVHPLPLRGPRQDNHATSRRDPPPIGFAVMPMLTFFVLSFSITLKSLLVSCSKLSESFVDIILIVLYTHPKSYNVYRRYMAPTINKRRAIRKAR